MNSLSNIITYFPDRIRNALSAEAAGGYITEIRLCLGKPVTVSSNGRIKSIGVGVDKECINRIVNTLTGGSLYSVNESLSRGYITITGGHRVGIGGTAVMDGDRVRTVKDISFLCFRIAREIKGCANNMAAHVVKGDRVLSCLVVSPPGYGKTTVIRDLARILGDGLLTRGPLRVGIADERCEIAPITGEQSCFDTGLGSFVLSGYPRNTAMEIMLRTMSPDVIITDEIGTNGDFEMLREAFRCGVAVIATAHGESMEELKCRFGDKTECFDKIFFIENKTGGFSICKDKGCEYKNDY